MEILPLIIQLASGAVGGNLAGKLMPKASMGTIGNSITGILGGGVGGYLLGMLGMGGAEGASMDMSNILTTIAGGGVGGGVLMTVIGYIKGMMGKKD